MKIVIAACSLGLWVLAAGCNREPALDASADSGPAAPAAVVDADAHSGCSGAEAMAVAETPTANAADGCGACPDAAAMAATVHDAADLTKGMILTEFTPISRILAAPATFEGKRVLVRGTAVAVCEKRGCWVELKSETANDRSLRVKVEDGEIVFPLTLKGHEVVVEGVVEQIVTPEQAYREILQKRAESKGEPFDPASVTGPHVSWQLAGLGARWDT